MRFGRRCPHREPPHRRLRHRAWIVAVLALSLAGCKKAGSTAASTPSSGPLSSPSASVASTSPSPAPSPSAATQTVAQCTDTTSEVSLSSQQGAAGTIRSVWQATNVSGEPCRSYAYPGMDFHESSGWLDLHVKRGGFPDINGTPDKIVLQPGESMYFVSYWKQADTDAGPCQPFDRLKVTLPDNFVSFVLTQTGCLSASLPVNVGPVTATAPAP